MSLEATSLVWQRTRAKGSNLLMLLAIADYAKDDGRWAWPSASTLAWKARLTGRGGRLILEKLVTDGEVWPEWDAPQHRLYLHVRCVSDWPAYQIEGTPFTRGREKFSDSQREIFSHRLVEKGTARLLEGKSAPQKGNTAARPSSSSDPSTDPRTDPEEKTRGRATPASVDAFVDVWNATTTAPIPKCLSLTKRRKLQIRAALLEHTEAEWAAIFARVEASPFLRGANNRNWTATLDWLIRSPDAAVKVLEGHFDDRTPTRQPPGPQAAPSAYSDYLETCPHTPKCGHPTRCRTLRDLAARKAKAS